MNDPIPPGPLGPSGPELPGGTLAGVLRFRAATDPDQVVHLFSEDGVTWPASLTFGELDRAARALAAWLQQLARPGDRALLLYPPGLDFTVGFWACLYAGLIAVPVAPPRLRKAGEGAARLRSIAASSGATLLLTAGALHEQLAAGLPAAGGFEQLRLVATDEPELAAAQSWVPPRLTGASVAYLQYSSGSTGTPKGVTLPHASVLANAMVIGRATQLGRSDRVVAWLPAFHDMGLLSGLILPVVHGYPTYQMPPLSFVRHPLDWLKAMSAVGGTVGVAPNFAYDLCVRRIRPDQAAELDLSAWRIAVCGAEPIRAQTLRAFAERFAVAGFRAGALFPCYGLAETTLLVAGGPCAGGMTTTTVAAEALSRGVAEPAAGHGTGHELVASGTPRAEFHLVVADPDTLQPQPDGRVGELLVRGDSVGAGYWDNPAETAATFGAVVPGHGDSFLRTGDLGFMQDGQLYVTGRRKDLIIVDGANHYPHDIEAVAGAAHPALRPGGCAAFQRADPSRSELVLVAEVDRAFRVQGPGAPAAPGRRSVALAELEASLRAAVSREFALRLDEVVLVRQGTIPLTTSGKMQRFALAELHRTGQLDAYRLAAGKNLVPG